ncbi:hypothetical protein, partial [Leptospira santarosai]|uniref:hypothetical protein n=1 Tax=Leptospira santarosai TaxID=28183 RepID=UPI001F30646D
SLLCKEPTANSTSLTMDRSVVLCGFWLSLSMVVFGNCETLPKRRVSGFGIKVLDKNKKRALF